MQTLKRRRDEPTSMFMKYKNMFPSHYIVMVQIGSFLESQGDDAETLHRECGLNYMKSAKQVGFIVSQTRRYVKVLVDRGYIVAVIHQLENEDLKNKRRKETKNKSTSVRREVDCVYTKSIFHGGCISSVRVVDGVFNVRTIDTTTCEKYCSDFPDIQYVLDSLVNSATMEVIIDDGFDTKYVAQIKRFLPDAVVRRVKSSSTILEDFVEKVHWKHSCTTVDGDNKHMVMDAPTLTNLNLVGKQSISVLINSASTPDGRIYLDKLIKSPYNNIELINKNLDFIRHIVDTGKYKDICESIGVNEHGKYSLKTFIYTVRNTDSVYPLVAAKLFEKFSVFVTTIKSAYTVLCEAHTVDDYSCNRLVEIIKHIDLALHSARTYDDIESKGALGEIEIMLRNFKLLSGCDDTVEVTKDWFIKTTQKVTVKGVYLRKKTERGKWYHYSTKEFDEYRLRKNIEGTNRLCLLADVCNECVRIVKKNFVVLCQVADSLARVDALAHFAELVRSYGMVRPEFCDKLEASGVTFINPADRTKKLEPNSISFTDTRTFILTGTNSSGKSTFKRVLAWNTILAHCGLYVFADSFKTPLVDKVCLRYASNDSIIDGVSSFRSELDHLGHMLRTVSGRSLVLLDEAFQSTHASSGQKLCKGLVKYLTDDIGCMTVFTTHYQDVASYFSKSTQYATIHTTVSTHESREQMFDYKLKNGVGQSDADYITKLIGLNLD